jgi:hypothetical protein
MVCAHGESFNNLQGFGLGPFAGRLIEKRLIRGNENRARHKGKDAEAPKRFARNGETKRMGAW